jgi:hypothetical protein
MRDDLSAQLAPLFPETRRRYARCLKKLGYPSPAEAEAVRTRRQRQVEEILHVYACEDCGFWHLTHKPLTVVQVKELWDILDAEQVRFEAALAQVQQLARPYLKFHSMYHKSIREIDEDFAHQLEALDRAMDYWMAMHQRTHAMRLAQVTTAVEARTEDIRAMAVLDESVRQCTDDREACLALHRHYREGAAQIFNQEYSLPAYDWRQYLVTSTCNRRNARVQ